jgi:hypothetical protein
LRDPVARRRTRAALLIARHRLRAHPNKPLSSQNTLAHCELEIAIQYACRTMYTVLRALVSGACAPHSRRARYLMQPEHTVHGADLGGLDQAGMRDRD